MPRPFDLSRFLALPGRRLIAITGKVHARSDALARLLSLLEREHIKVCSAFANFEGEYARILAFLDVTDSVVPVEEIGKVSEMLGIFEVESVTRSAVEGFIADTTSHPIVAGQYRTILLRSPGYEEFLVGIREWFGRSGENFLYHIGYRVGLGHVKFHMELAERIGLKDPALIYKNISAAMFQWAGYGVVEVEELVEDHGTLAVRDSFECELGKGRGIVYSQFTRGIIAGTLTELFGKRFNVVEKECIAKGDPVCRFMVKALSERKPTKTYNVVI
ncbi:MAG: 4-vinyl reductase [Candidatus Methanomethyliaceae archaeon]|nr:4-vinyl reductase [Candidatus Methanomethyliaceae archaeon]